AGRNARRSGRSRAGLAARASAVSGASPRRPGGSPPSDGAPDHQFLDLADRLGRIEPLRAHVDAIHDRVAAEQPVRILEVVEALAGGLVAAVREETISLQQA